MSSHPKGKNIWKIIGGTIIVLVVAFVASRIVPIVRGSDMKLNIPKDSEVSEPVVNLSGKVIDTKKLTVNGSIIPLSPTGTFTYTLLLHPGYNTITFDTTDALNHTKKQTYAFLLKELPTGTFALSALPNTN